MRILQKEYLKNILIVKEIHRSLLIHYHENNKPKSSVTSSIDHKNNDTEIVNQYVVFANKDKFTKKSMLLFFKKNVPC